jgi:nucleotide-binding universal stress UspA family protein
MRSDIVVGVDASVGSAAALDWALDAAARRGVRVRAVLAYADDGRPVEVDAVASSPALDDLARAAGVVLRRVVATARSVRPGPGDTLTAGVPVDEKAVYSSPAYALLEESLSAEMLVVGAWPRTVTRWALPGPVADVCAHECPVPLVVVPGDLGGPPPRLRDDRPVVVGVDGSPASAHAARWAAAEAAVRGVALKVVRVEACQTIVAPAPRAKRQMAAACTAAMPAAPAGPGLLPAESAAGALSDPGGRRDPGDSLLEELRATPGLAGVAQVTARGATVAALLEAGSRAQLVVVGARGAGGFPALALGGTAHRCLAQAVCPTAIIRGGHV